MNASNPVVIDAAPGQSYADISREFEAPVEAVFRAHADPRAVQGSGSDPASLADEHHALGLPHRRRLPLRADGCRRQHLRVPRRLPHRPRERAADPDVRVRGHARRGQHRHHAVRGACRAAARGSSTTACSRRVEVLEGMMAEGMEYGMNEGYEKLDEMLAAGA